MRGGAVSGAGAAAGTAQQLETADGTARVSPGWRDTDDFLSLLLNGTGMTAMGMSPGFERHAGLGMDAHGMHASPTRGQHAQHVATAGAPQVDEAGPAPAQPQQPQQQGQQAVSQPQPGGSTIKLLLKPYDEGSRQAVAALHQPTHISIPITKYVRGMRACLRSMHACTHARGGSRPAKLAPQNTHTKRRRQQVQ